MYNRADAETEKIFLSYISHRIRTPLNSVIGFSKLLLNRDQEEERTKEFAERILDSGYEILHYFQSIMDLSEIESGMITVTPDNFRVNQTLSALVGEFSDRFRSERNIGMYFNEFSENQGLTARTDEFIFRRILTNLIELVLSLISEGEIQVSCIKTEDNQLKTYVRGASYSDLNSFDKSFVINDPYDAMDPDSIEYLTYKATKKLCQLLKGTFEMEKKTSKSILYSFQIPIDITKEND